MVRSVVNAVVWTGDHIDQLERELKGAGVTTVQAERIKKKLAPVPITVPKATGKYLVTANQIYGWIYRGYLHPISRVKGPGRGGQVVLDENELVHLIENPPLIGRKAKNHRQLIP